MPIILRQNEELIKIARKHGMFFWPHFLIWLLLAVTPAILSFLLDFDFFGYRLEALTIWILVVALIVARRYFIWRNNILVITSQRVVKNEQQGLFSKVVTEVLLDDIAGVSYEKNGLSASLHNFGDIKIQTAFDSCLVAEKIARPSEIIDFINNLRSGGHLVQ